DSDARTTPSCSTGNPWSSTISYIGTEYERALYGTVYYNHTLPPNWNRKVSSNQRYNCGDTGITYFHVSASSYHTGGVNLVMADGSVRFVRDSINFTSWQAVGSKAGGEVVSNDQWHPARLIPRPAPPSPGRAAIPEPATRQVNDMAQELRVVLIAFFCALGAAAGCSGPGGKGEQAPQQATLQDVADMIRATTQPNGRGPTKLADLDRVREM